MKVSAFDLHLIVNTIQAQKLSDSAQVRGGLPLAPGLAYSIFAYVSNTQST